MPRYDVGGRASAGVKSRESKASSRFAQFGRDSRHARQPRRTVRIDTFDAAFIITLAIFSALPLLFPFFISQDGPSHIAAGSIIKHLLLRDNTLTSSFFRLVPWSITNSFVQYIAAALLVVVPKPILVDQLIAASLIFLIPFSAWCLSRCFARSNKWVVLAALPFGFGVTLLTGEYNTVFSFAFAVLAVSLTVSCQGEFGLGQLAKLSALLAVTSWCHPLGIVFALACGGAALLILLAGRAPRQAFMMSVATLAWFAPRLLRPMAAALPAVLIQVLFLWRFARVHAVSQLNGHSGPTPLHRVFALVSLRQLDALARSQIALCIALSTLLVILCAVALVRRARQRGIVPQDSVLAAALVAAVLSVAIPNAGHGSDYLAVRLDYLPWLFAIPWLSWVLPDSQLLRRALLPVLSAIVAGFFLTNLVAVRAKVASLRPYVLVLRQIPPGSVVLPMTVFREPGDSYILSHLHLHSLIGAAKDSVMLNEWDAHYRGFPVTFRRRADPYRELLPDDVDSKHFLQYESQARHKVDYVIVWLPKAQISAGDSVISEMRNGWHKVASASNQNGMEALLFRRDTVNPLFRP